MVVIYTDCNYKEITLLLDLLLLICFLFDEGFMLKGGKE